MCSLSTAGFTGSRTISSRLMSSCEPVNQDMSSWVCRVSWATGTIRSKPLPSSSSLTTSRLRMTTFTESTLSERAMMRTNYRSTHAGRRMVSSRSTESNYDVTTDRSFSAIAPRCRRPSIQLDICFMKSQTPPACGFTFRFSGIRR